MKRSTKVVVGCVLAAAGVVCAVLLFNGSGSPPPDPNEATAQETVEYLASEEFVKMDNDNKEEYLKQINQTYTETPVLTLFLNSDLSEQQQVRLDAIIDRLEEQRRENPQAMFSPERFNLMLQYVDPRTRARIRKHIPAIRKRMAECGIPTGDQPF